MKKCALLGLMMVALLMTFASHQNNTGKIAYDDLPGPHFIVTQM